MFLSCSGTLPPCVAVYVPVWLAHERVVVISAAGITAAWVVRTNRRRPRGLCVLCVMAIRRARVVWACVFKFREGAGWVSGGERGPFQAGRPNQARAQQ